MSKHSVKILLRRIFILIAFYILAGCSERSFVVNIDPESNDLVDHYSVCVQVGTVKYDLFTVPKDTSRALLHTQPSVSAGTDFSISIRAISSRNEVLGAGRSSATVSDGWMANHVMIPVKNFSDPYQNCYDPGFCPDPKYAPTNTAWYGVWTADTGDEGWAVGADVDANSGEPIRPRISHYYNRQWSLVPDQMFPDGIVSRHIAINAVWGSDESHVWAVGGGKDGDGNSYGIILYWDGKTWANISDRNTCGVGSSLYGVWGPKRTTLSAQTSDQCRVWVVGDNGTVICFNGGSWDCSKTVPLSSNRKPILRKVWGSSSSNVWVVGGYAYCGEKDCPRYELILRREGNEWREHQRTDMEHAGFVTSLSGIDEKNLWAVTDSAKILLWDGEQWKSKPPQSQNLTIDFNEQDKCGRFINGFNSIWMGGENDVLIAMYSGKVLHWHRDSTQVEHWQISDKVSSALLALSGADACNVLLAGDANYRAVYLPDALGDAR